MFGGASLLLLLGLGGWGWWTYQFPYGHSHSCSKGLGLALHTYAEEHGGWLPHGEATPEASLGLIGREDLSEGVWLLGGKNVPGEVVRMALTNGSFGPATCGWHYIEGLREDDDPEIMVAWDKTIGLGHNGERRRGLMHEIVLLDGSTRYVSKAAWPGFVAEQRKKLDRLIAVREPATPPIRWSDEATFGPNRFPPAQR